jgi:hypothetical protein
MKYCDACATPMHESARVCPNCKRPQQVNPPLQSQMKRDGGFKGWGLIALGLAVMVIAFFGMAGVQCNSSPLLGALIYGSPSAQIAGSPAYVSFFGLFDMTCSVGYWFAAAICGIPLLVWSFLAFRRGRRTERLVTAQTPAPVAPGREVATKK